SKQVGSEVEALMALDRGDTARAARLASSWPPPDSATVLGAPRAGLAQFVQAEVYARLGDLRRAVRLYEAFDPEDFGVGGVDPRWPFFARSFLARGQLYEQLGERQKAIAAYERFIELWKDASPELQEQLREARSGLARLRDAPEAVVR
ncbi:MAG: tetratricopeptide repeat protein, partial [Gemmatimonadota bacterium]|nr:tetratricopeptide repeat protein [Gemmatimonadota bacterium]